MIVKLKDVVNRVNNNIDRFNTDIKYYLGKGHGECGEIAITEHGDLKQDVGLLGFKFHFSFKPKDTLFFSRSFALRKAGMAMYEGICSDSTYILRSKDENCLYPEFLPLIMQSDSFWEYCDTHHTGGVNFLINWSTLADYEFTLPPLPEQKALAEKLWAAYRLKVAYKKLLAATDEMVKAKFVEMFGEIKTQKQLELKKLRDIVHPDCPISYGIVQPGDGIENGIPVVRPVDLNPNLFVYRNGLKMTSENISNLYKRTILRGDELLLCVRGTTGIMGIATEELRGCNVTRGITPLFFKEGVNRIYILCVFLSDETQKYIADNTIGSALKNINMDKVREMPIPLPPIEQQNKFEKIFIQTYNAKTALQKSLESIDLVIKSLINK